METVPLGGFFLLRAREKEGFWELENPKIKISPYLSITLLYARQREGKQTIRVQYHSNNDSKNTN